MGVSRCEGLARQGGTGGWHHNPLGAGGATFALSPETVQRQVVSPESDRGMIIEGADSKDGVGIYSDDSARHPPRLNVEMETASNQDYPVLVGAGDISRCSNDNDKATAKLLDNTPGTVATLGDNAYNEGSAAQYTNCYDPTWGRVKARTMPSVGNHEYLTPDAAGYFDYFGAGDPNKGYYSYDLGSWYMVVLNSGCEYVGGAGPRIRRSSGSAGPGGTLDSLHLGVLALSTLQFRPLRLRGTHEAGLECTLRFRCGGGT